MICLKALEKTRGDNTPKQLLGKVIKLRAEVVIVTTTKMYKESIKWTASCLKKIKTNKCLAKLTKGKWEIIQTNMLRD